MENREIVVNVKPIGGEPQRIAVPLSMPTSEFIRQIVDHLGLTGVDQQGQPAVWALDNKKTSRELDSGKTIEENQVSNEDELILRRQIIAGSGVLKP